MTFYAVLTPNLRLSKIKHYISLTLSTTNHTMASKQCPGVNCDLANLRKSVCQNFPVQSILLNRSTDIFDQTRHRHDHHRGRP